MTRKLSFKSAFAQAAKALDNGASPADVLAILNQSLPAPKAKRARKASALPEGVPELRGLELLTVGNPKTVKGQKQGYLTFILHFAAADLSGFNVCPMATTGCTKACLNLAGQGGIAKGGLLTYDVVMSGKRTNHVQKARIRRTRYYFEDRAGFYMTLRRDMDRAISYCAQYGMIPVFRLNGTSDVRFEKDDCGNGRSIFETYPQIQFYDYTKLTNRRNLPANYHLTFSLADGNDKQAFIALKSGLSVAAVFRDKATLNRYIESGFELGGQLFTVVNGDESDLRFLDPRGVIVGLYAKGPNAKKDQSGFVRD